MRKYELAYIADPDLDQEGLEALEARVIGWIEAADGVVGEIDRWGKRKLAYSIKHKSEGVYTIVSAEMQPDSSAKIEQDLRINEQILRYMITLQDQISA